MNTRLKKVLITGLVMVGIGAVHRAQAATTDTMLVSVSPAVTFAVSISSPFTLGNAGYQFGPVALSATTLSTVAITLNTTGANAYEYFGVSISNTSGNWTSTASAPGVDTFRMGAWIGSSQPTAGNVTDYLSAPPYAETAATKFNQASPTAYNSTASLWLKLEMPTNLNTGGNTAQTMTLTVTAQGS